MYSDTWSIERLCQIAEVACFQTNYQSKSEAQSYFMALSQNLSAEAFQEILLQGTDTLIFVTAEYLNKNISWSKPETAESMFSTIQSVLHKWYDPKINSFLRGNCHFFQKNGPDSNTMVQNTKPLPKYIERSLVTVITNQIKALYMQESKEKAMLIVSSIQSTSDQRWKLFLYKAFIDNVSSIDRQMGYVRYRNLCYRFQEEVIPLIAKTILPFLTSVEDLMKVNEISSMQSKLSFEDPIPQQDNQISGVFQSESEFAFAQMVFDSLHALVFYTYHLTWSEYEQGSSFQNCLICFPEAFTNKVATEEFMQSLGYVIERLISTLPKSQFLATTLQCLQKIFLTKLSYIHEEKKSKFVEASAQMITRIYEKAAESGGLDLMTQILYCNNKFVNNIEISYFKEKAELKGAFQNWLFSFLNITTQMMQRVDLSEQFNFNTERSFVIEALELYSKIISSLFGSTCFYSFEEDLQAFDSEKQFVESSLKNVIATILEKLLGQGSDVIIVGSTAEIFKTNILDIKHICEAFFKPFKEVSSLRYEFLFAELLKRIPSCLSSQTAPGLKFNAFLFLAEMLERNFLERSIVLTRASELAVEELSKSMNVAFKFLVFYMEERTSLSGSSLNDQVLLMDISIMIFLERVLSEFLAQIQNSQNAIEIGHRVFLSMLSLEGSKNETSKMSEKFVSEGIKYILKFLLLYNPQPESKNVSVFVFETIYRILMKFKWGSRREVFRSSEIYKVLSSFFTSILEETKIPKQVESGNGGVSAESIEVFRKFHQLKWRKHIMKMIALLYFDDIIDDYRENLRKMFSSISSEHILVYLVDITGIADVVDTATIFKEFLELMGKHLPFGQLSVAVENFGQHFSESTYDKLTKKHPRITVIKALLKMHKAVLQNKGQRLSSNKNNFLVYNLLEQALPFWTKYVSESSSDQWVPVICQIIQTLTQVIKSDKFNFYVLQRNFPRQYLQMINAVLQCVLRMSDKMEELPKLNSSSLQFLVGVSREILAPLFFPSLKIVSLSPEQSKKSGIVFIKIFLTVFKRLGANLEQCKAQSSEQKKEVEQSLDVIRFTFSFVNQKVDLMKFMAREPTEHEKALALYVEDMKSLVFSYEKSLIEYLMKERPMTSNQRNMCIIVYQGAILYPGMLETLLGGMQIPNYLFQDVQRFLKNIKDSEQDPFVSNFKEWLKSLHCTEEEILKKRKHQNEQLFGIIGIRGGFLD